MEKVMDDLKKAELMKESIRRTFDQAHAQASSIILFTLKWKELEDQFNSVKDSLSKQAQELAVKEKKLVETAHQLEQRDQNVEIKLNEVKQGLERQLGLIKKRIEESTLELRSAEKQLDLARKEFDSCNGMLSMKKGQLEVAHKKLEKCNEELSVKNQQLYTVQKSLEEHNQVLKSREKKLCLVNAKLEECSKELSVKNEQLELVKKAHQVCSMELETKKQEMEKVKNSVVVWNEELVLKQKESSTVRNLISDISSELVSKEKQLKMLQDLTEHCSGDLDLKQSKLNGIEESIDQCLKELDLKRKELDATQKMTEDSLKEFNLKQEELSRVQRLIEECSKDLDSKVEHLNSIKALTKENTEELEAKEKEYDEMKKSVSDCSAKLTLKEKELDSIEESSKKYSSKLHSLEKHARRADRILRLKEKALSSMKKTKRKYYEDLELKEREFNAVRESIKERNEDLQLKEKLLKSVQTSIVECSEELELKKGNIDLVEKSLKECLDKLAMKEAELDSIKRTAGKVSKEIEERENYCDSLKRTLEERLENLGMKERHLEECAKELELKEIQLDTMQKSVEECSKQVELKEKQLNSNIHSQEMLVQPENCLGNNTVNSLTMGLKSCTKVSGRNLLLFLNEHFRKHDLIHSEVFTAIQKSADPGNLVLNAVQGLYYQGLNKGDMEFDLSVIRRSFNTLLEKLLKISPQIQPQLREEALKLACEWKSRIRADPENTLEVLGFLQLLAAFKLAYAFNADELQHLLGTVSQHMQAPELREALLVTGNSPDIVSQHRQAPELPETEARQVLENLPDKRMEQMQHLGSSGLMRSSSANCQSGTTILERSPPLFLDEEMDGHDLKPQEILAALKTSANPARIVLDVIQALHSRQLKNEGADLDGSIVWNKVLLLEQLIKVSPTVGVLLKEEATKLAVSWKANIRLDNENSLEVWAFLLFIMIYGFVFHFGREEIFRLVMIVAHKKRAPDICRILGFAAKIPEIIQSLIQRKQYIEAVRFSCEFGLVDKFSPEGILEQYIEDIWTGAWISENRKDLLQAQDKAVDEELNALKSILECTAEWKFESRLLTQKINSCISDLKKRKAGSIHSPPAPALVAQPQMQYHHPGSRDKPSPTPVVGQQLYDNRSLREGVQRQPLDSNKRPRVIVPVDRQCSAKFANQSTRK